MAGDGDVGKGADGSKMRSIQESSGDEVGFKEN